MRTLARERIAPRAAEIDHTAEFPHDLAQLLGEQGILGLGFDGGARRRRRRRADAARRDRGDRQGLRDDGAHPRGAGARLARAQARGLARSSKQRYLPRLASRRVAAGLRAHRGGLRARTRRRCARRRAATATRYVLDGSKRFITNAGRRAALHRLREDRSGGGAQGHLLLPRRGGHARLPGRADRAEARDQGLDDRRALLRRLPRPGGEPRSARRARASGSRCASSTARGPASRRRRSASPRARPTTPSNTPKEREAFGKPIVEHELVAAKLAEMETRCEAARGVLYRCGRRSTRARARAR